MNVHHSQNSQDVKYALTSPLGSVDFNDALTTREDEQNLNSDINNNEPLWTIIEDKGKKRKVLQSSSDEETKKSAINYYLGSFVNSLPPILKGNVEKKAKKTLLSVFSALQIFVELYIKLYFSNSIRTIQK